jgi:hypothetical protein
VISIYTDDRRRGKKKKRGKRRTRRFAGAGASPLATLPARGVNPLFLPGRHRKKSIGGIDEDGEVMG